MRGPPTPSMLLPALPGAGQQAGGGIAQRHFRRPWTRAPRPLVRKARPTAALLPGGALQATGAHEGEARGEVFKVLNVL